MPGSGEFRVIQFAEGGIPIRLGELNGARQQGGAEADARVAALVRSGAIAAELQWRISTPMLALILMVLAVPLARLRPRQGRFGRIGIAILAYFVYSQLLDRGAHLGRERRGAGVRRDLVGARRSRCASALWLLVRDSPPGEPRRVAVPA